MVVVSLCLVDDLALEMACARAWYLERNRIVVVVVVEIRDQFRKIREASAFKEYWLIAYHKQEPPDRLESVSMAVFSSTSCFFAVAACCVLTYSSVSTS